MKIKLCILWILLSTQGLWAQQNTRYIDVTGTAQKEYIPDEYYITVELKEYYRNKNKVDIDTIKRHFLQTCKQCAIPDSNISVADIQGKTIELWKRKSNRLQREDLLQSMVYLLKFKRIADVEFFADKLDPEFVQLFELNRVGLSKLEEIRKELKGLAIKNAKEKAIYLTQAINQKVGDAIQIEEDAERLHTSENSRSSAINTYNGKEGKIGRRADSDVLWWMNPLDYGYNANGSSGQLNFKKLIVTSEIGVRFELVK